MPYKCILLETDGAVGVITLNRPDALNAFSNQLMDELTDALKKMEADDEIGCIVITGSEKAFAAGADIKEMATKTYMDVFNEQFITRNWEETTRCRKPVIAAVAGYALGGGCELAMMCGLHHRRRQRQIRPAGNHHRRDAGRRAARSVSRASSASRRRWRCASRAA